MDERRRQDDAFGIFRQRLFFRPQSQCCSLGFGRAKPVTDRPSVAKRRLAAGFGCAKAGIEQPWTSPSAGTGSNGAAINPPMPFALRDSLSKKPVPAGNRLIIKMRNFSDLDG